MAKTIILDPGHSGPRHDPGAVGPAGTNESALALSYSLDLEEALEAAGFRVVLTRAYEGVRRVSLEERVEIARQCAPAPALFLSIHMNAVARPDPRGFQVITSPGQTFADVFATSIYKEIARQAKDCPRELILRADLSDRDPDFEDRLYVLTRTTVPAVLVECGFISNPDEEILLKTPSHRRRIVAGIVAGILGVIKP